MTSFMLAICLSGAGQGLAADTPANAVGVAVSVAEFGAVPAGDPSLVSLAHAYSAMLPGELSKNKNLRVVDASQRAEVMKEQALSEALTSGSEQVGGTSARKMGTTTGDFVVVGKLVSYRGGKALCVRVVSAATGEAIGGWVIQSPSDPSATAVKLAASISDAVRGGGKTAGLPVAINASGTGPGREIAEAASEMIASEMVKAAGVRVLERGDLAGVTAESVAAGAAPKLSGAKYVVSVSSSQAASDSIEVRALEAGTGRVIKSWKAAISSSAKTAAEVAASLASGS